MADLSTNYTGVKFENPFILARVGDVKPNRTSWSTQAA